MRLTLIVLLASSVAALAQPKPTTEQDVQQELRRVEKNCAFAFAAAIPRVPGLEILAVRSVPTVHRESWSFTAVVEADVKAIGRSETFRGFCTHDILKGPDISDVTAKP